MALQRVRVQTEEYKIFSPFTGQLVCDEDGEINESDPTLLFVYYGNAADFAYCSDRFKESLGEDCSPFDIEEACKSSNLPNALVIEVDNGWNGINFYGFVLD